MPCTRTRTCSRPIQVVTSIFIGQIVHSEQRRLAKSDKQNIRFFQQVTIQPLCSVVWVAPCSVDKSGDVSFLTLDIFLFNFDTFVIGATARSYFVELWEQKQRNSDTDMIYARLPDCGMQRSQQYLTRQDKGGSSDGNPNTSPKPACVGMLEIICCVSLVNCPTR